MAAKRNRQSEQAGPGWLATLGGAAVLLVAGFVVGLLAGTAWEEPDLVIDHLAGRTTELPLATDVSAALAEAQELESVARPLGARASSPAAPRSEVDVDLPSVSARPPTARPAPPAGRPAPSAGRPAPSAGRPAPSAGRPAPSAPDGFSIQVGAFDDRATARKLAGELRAGGFSVYIHSDDGSGGARYRVRVGPVPSREEATRLAGKLESDHQLPTWVLSPNSH